jgi:hypothetical protein
MYVIKKNKQYGSIVIQTFKKEILMSINVSKEWAYNAGSKYINFIKFSITRQRLRA